MDYILNSLSNESCFILPLMIAQTLFGQWEVVYDFLQ